MRPLGPKILLVPASPGKHGGKTGQNRRQFPPISSFYRRNKFGPRRFLALNLEATSARTVRVFPNRTENKNFSFCRNRQKAIDWLGLIGSFVGSKGSLSKGFTKTFSKTEKTWFSTGKTDFRSKKINFFGHF